jgi:lipoprotein-anchoring transpeptidase ErfK/SrfK
MAAMAADPWRQSRVGRSGLLMTRGPPGRRMRFAVAAALIVAVPFQFGCSSRSGPSAQPAASSGQATTTTSLIVATSSGPSTTSSSAPSSLPTPVDVTTATASGASLVAQSLVAKVPVHAAMSATSRVTTTLANPNEDGAPLVFLVAQNMPGWLLVDLPLRPNGSQGWIQESLVRVTVDPYRIVIERRAHQLTLYRNDQVTLQVPVGIGTSRTPTPGGIFYIKELLQPPTPTGPYGPYAFGLSGFSDVLKSFAGGNGVIGLHGTNEPQYIGKDVSHGCIRLYNADILKLVQLLPLGTPVEIAA